MTKLHKGIKCEEEGLSLHEFCSECLSEHYANIADAERKRRKEERSCNITSFVCKETK